MRVVPHNQWILDNIEEGKCDEDAPDDVIQGEENAQDAQMV